MHNNTRVNEKQTTNDTVAQIFASFSVMKLKLQAAKLGNAFNLLQNHTLTPNSTCKRQTRQNDGEINGKLNLQ